MKISIFNSICYSIGWLWCVLTGMHGHNFLAFLGASILIFIQLYYTKKTYLSLYIQDVLLVVFSVPLGFFLEVILIQSGLVQYANGSGFPPLWIIMLYPLFALLINHSLKMIKSSYLIAFSIGFLGAPISYLAGQKLGAVSLPYPLLLNWIIIGMYWGIFLCVCAKAATIIQKAAEATLKDRDTSLEMLYDGGCPICKREIAFLKKRDLQGKITFVNIASKDYSPAKHHNIKYETAMSKIHAIDNKGHVLVGVPVFAAAYAKCRLLLIATLFRIPLIKVMLFPFYTLFAKSRHLFAKLAR